jgi:hypothetical protein
MDTMMSSVREVVVALKAAGAKPRFHGGIGMIQLHLNQTTRIHVWHPSMPPTRPDSAVHNHRFSFRSLVLRGELAHKIVAPVDGSTLDLWETFTEDGREPERVGSCDLTTVEESILARGEGYAFEAGRFHCSEPRGITVTQMTKTWQSTGRVFVVAKPGTSMRHAFNGSPQRVGEMWDLLLDAVGVR